MSGSERRSQEIFCRNPQARARGTSRALPAACSATPHLAQHARAGEWCGGHRASPPPGRRRLVSASEDRASVGQSSEQQVWGALVDLDPPASGPAEPRLRSGSTQPAPGPSKVDRVVMQPNVVYFLNQTTAAHFYCNRKWPSESKHQWSVNT
jgi:hypothetical protein